MGVKFSGPISTCVFGTLIGISMFVAMSAFIITAPYELLISLPVKMIFNKDISAWNYFNRL